MSRRIRTRKRIGRSDGQCSGLLTHPTLLPKSDLKTRRFVSIPHEQLASHENRVIPRDVLGIEGLEAGGFFRAGGRCWNKHDSTVFTQDQQRLTDE